MREGEKKKKMTESFGRVLGIMFAVSCLQQMAVRSALQLLFVMVLMVMHNFLLRI
jgi:hypothetical protein